jgi:DNA-binding MarR family transcriptional regulator
MNEIAHDSAATLLRGMLALGRRLRAERPPGSLSLSGLGILGALNRIGPLVATRLAAEERLQPQSLTRLLGYLEKDRLIRRMRSRDDRREITITITARGRRVLLEDMAVRRAWLEKALAAALEPVERGVLRAAAPVMLKLAACERR